MVDRLTPSTIHCPNCICCQPPKAFYLNTTTPGQWKLILFSGYLLAHLSVTERSALYPEMTEKMVKLTVFSPKSPLPYGCNTQVNSRFWMQKHSRFQKYGEIKLLTGSVSQNQGISDSHHRRALNTLLLQMTGTDKMWSIILLALKQSEKIIDCFHSKQVHKSNWTTFVEIINRLLLETATSTDIPPGFSL